MRIIAGSAGGITLKSPAHDARPTSDRVREALFSMLGDLTAGACVLDLFAGSGALGIEALSRGAREAVFVEQHAGACGVIEGNLVRAKLEGGCVLKSEVFAALRKLGVQGGRFDIVFADPPYAKRPGDEDFGAQLLASPQLAALLADDGWFVLECMMTRQMPRAISGWRIVRDRAYGSTRVLLLQRDPTTVLHAEIPGSAAL